MYIYIYTGIYPNIEDDTYIYIYTYLHMYIYILYIIYCVWYYAFFWITGIIVSDYYWIVIRVDPIYVPIKSP